MQSISESWVETLVQLHQVDIETAGLSDFGKPEGYVSRQVDGWIGRYQKSQTDEIKAIMANKQSDTPSIPAEGEVR